MPSSSPAPSTLIQVLRRAATESPDRIAFTFLKDGEIEDSSHTHASLDLRARAIAARLGSIAVPGERALLLYPSGLEFVAALFGCLYAGLVAVPAYPLETGHSKRGVSRLRTIVQSARPAVALTDEASLKVVEGLIPDYPDLKDSHWLSTENIPDDLAAGWRDPEVEGGSLAILQYTSGSTTTPRGVMLSNSNIIANLEMFRQTFGYSASNTFVSWLPLAHDLGLFGHVVLPLYLGAPSVLMTPEDFIRKPVRWLRAISRYENVVTRGPNFAFELCAKRIAAEEREGLDLRSLHTASCGGEPVRIDTLDGMLHAFEACGFRRETFLSSYGLAEATLLVSAGRNPRALRVGRDDLERKLFVEKSRLDVPGRTFLSVGVPSLGQTVMIVDPATQTQCEAGTVGEIWISGSNVAMGYWDRPDDTATTFRGVLQDTGEGPFLRTGDLGCFHEGELFIAGRIKDLIILRGRNYYPDDLELAVEKCHKALRPGGAVAFSAEFGSEESLVIIQEVRDPIDTGWEEVIATIRRCLFDTCGVSSHCVVLVKPRSVPKTSSGKLQRRACREAFLDNRLDVVMQSPAAVNSDREHLTTFVAPRTDHEQKLARIWSEILKVERIGIHDSFIQLGGDSVAAISCVAAMRAAFETEDISPEIFLYAPTLASMAEVLSDAGTLRQPWTKVVPIQPNGQGIPLVLVSQGLECRYLSGHLGPNRPVLSIHSSFWEHPTMNSTIEQFAAECVDALRRFQLQSPHASSGPYALGGWCAAGVVALEMARQLENSGEEIAFVVLFDDRDIYMPPMSPFRRFATNVVRSINRLAWRVGREGPKALGYSVTRRMDQLNQVVRPRFERVPVNQDVVGQMLRSWSPSPWHGRMIHLWAAERPRGRFHDPAFIWGDFSRQAEFHDVPGDHCSILLEPNIASIAEILSAELDRSRSAGSAGPAA